MYLYVVKKSPNPLPTSLLQISLLNYVFTFRISLKPNWLFFSLCLHLHFRYVFLFISFDRSSYSDDGLIYIQQGHFLRFWAFMPFYNVFLRAPVGANNKLCSESLCENDPELASHRMRYICVALQVQCATFLTSGSKMLSWRVRFG